MAHAGDYRDTGFRNGPGYLFLIEGPQILHGAAAAAHQQHL